ncbi:MAG: 3-hydroxyacyl-ACP dehydratase FabZ [Myxococcota bacterium]|nr:3-hydroxyacyl-ACP dehydratase FabZ [Myxococcota bacterium]
MPTAARTPTGLDRQALEALLPHREPMFMLDEVMELEPGVRARARKAVRSDEPWVAGHFPGDPVFPGVLLTEVFAQAAGVVALTANPEHAGTSVYLVGLDRVRFRRPVRPGDVLDVEVETLDVRRGIWRFRARATVSGERTAEAEVMATVAEGA